MSYLEEQVRKVSYLSVPSVKEEELPAEVVKESYRQYLLEEKNEDCNDSQLLKCRMSVDFEEPQKRGTTFNFD